MNVENRKGCCGLECPLLGRPSTLRIVGVPPPPSASIPLFFFPSLRLSLPLPSLRWDSPSSSSVHFRAFALSSFLFAALRDIWIVGSHLPHYHTNRPLTHSDTAFILCPSHLRLAGDQPKSGLVHDQSLERADRESYELAREPLAWGTRRKSIILNHGMIGSNDQTTARRMSLRGDLRGRATSHLCKDFVFPSIFLWSLRFLLTISIHVCRLLIIN